MKKESADKLVKIKSVIEEIYGDALHPTFRTLN